MPEIPSADPKQMRLPRRNLRMVVAGLAVLLAVMGLFVALLWPKAEVLPVELAKNLTLREGLLYGASTNLPFTGWMIERYDDATMKSRSMVRQGVLNGVSEGWFTNGVRQVEEHFVAGKSEGPVTKWYASGAKLSEGTARSGRLEGLFRRWHENGQLAEELSLVSGAPDGVAKSWFPSGSPKAEVTLSEGRVVTQRFWKDGEQLPEQTVAVVKGKQ